MIAKMMKRMEWYQSLFVNCCCIHILESLFNLFWFLFVKRFGYQVGTGQGRCREQERETKGMGLEEEGTK